MSRPLPEGQWFWRRLFVWAVTGGLMFKLNSAIDRLAISDLRSICERLILLLAVMSAFYLIGPTAEHMVALVRAWRGENSK